MIWIGYLWEAAAALVIVAAVVATLREIRRGPAIDDLAPLPWWYCCYCGNIFNHPLTARDLCPTYEAMRATYTPRTAAS